MPIHDVHRESGVSSKRPLMIASSGDGDLRTVGFKITGEAGVSLVRSSVSFVDSSGDERTNCVDATKSLRS